jgi:hypothetical protein
MAGEVRTLLVVVYQVYQRQGTLSVPSKSAVRRWRSRRKRATPRVSLDAAKPVLPRLRQAAARGIAPECIANRVSAISRAGELGLLT